MCGGSSAPTKLALVGDGWVHWFQRLQRRHDWGNDL